MSAPDPRRCRSCDTVIERRHCGECGERWIPEGGEPFVSTVGAWLGDFFGTDGRVWQTLFATVFRPGLLTVDYLRGKRQPYLRPLQLFVVCNVLYFIVQPFTLYNAFQNDLDGQVSRQAYMAITAEVVAEQLRESTAELVELGLDEDAAQERAKVELVRRYDGTTGGLSKAFLFLMIPIVAVGLILVAPRAGPSTWVVLATHLVCFMLVGVQLGWGLVLSAGRGPFFALDRNLQWLLGEGMSMILVIVYATLATRRLDGRRWLLALGSGLLVTYWATTAVIAYRFALFWITWRAIH